MKKGGNARNHLQQSKVFFSGGTTILASPFNFGNFVNLLQNYHLLRVIFAPTQ
jgi:hypothetical protein